MCHVIMTTPTWGQLALDLSVGHLLVGRVEGRYTAPQTAESEPDVLGTSAGTEAGPQHLRLAVLGQNLAVAVDQDVLVCSCAPARRTA